MNIINNEFCNNLLAYSQKRKEKKKLTSITSSNKGSSKIKMLGVEKHLIVFKS